MKEVFDELEWRSLEHALSPQLQAERAREEAAVVQRLLNDDVALAWLVTADDGAEAEAEADEQGEHSEEQEEQEEREGAGNEREAGDHHASASGAAGGGAGAALSVSQKRRCEAMYKDLWALSSSAASEALTVVQREQRDLIEWRLPTRTVLGLRCAPPPPPLPPSPLFPVHPLFFLLLLVYERMIERITVLELLRVTLF